MNETQTLETPEVAIVSSLQEDSDATTEPNPNESEEVSQDDVGDGTSTVDQGQDLEEDAHETGEGKGTATDLPALGEVSCNREPTGSWGGRRFSGDVEVTLTVQTSLLDVLRTRVDGEVTRWTNEGEQWSCSRTYGEGGPYSLPLVEAYSGTGSFVTNEGQRTEFGSFWVDSHAPQVTSARLEGGEVHWDEEDGAVVADGTDALSLVLEATDEQGLATAEFVNGGNTCALAVEEGATSAVLRIPVAKGLDRGSLVRLTDLAGNVCTWSMSEALDSENVPLSLALDDGTTRDEHPQHVVFEESPVPATPAAAPRPARTVRNLAAAHVSGRVSTPVVRTAEQSKASVAAEDASKALNGGQSEESNDDAPTEQASLAVTKPSSLPFVADLAHPKVSVNVDGGSASSQEEAAQGATVRVVEKNFDSERVHVTTDGQTGTWWHHGSVHELPVRFDGNGEHRVMADYEDARGSVIGAYDTGTFRAESRPTFELTGVTDGCAYSGEVNGTVTVRNIGEVDASNMEVKLTRNDGKPVAQPQVIVENGEARVVLPDLPQTADFDDVYTLSVSVKDQAGNESASSTRFSLNRCGSTFEVLDETLAKGMSYLRESPTVRIREINVSGVEVGKRHVWVTRDTETTELSYSANPGVGEFGMVEEPDARGWSSVTYLIPPENFSQDGSYRIAVASDDLAGNHNLNLLEKDGREVAFVLDTTPPTVSIEGVCDDQVTEGESMTVTVRASDLVGLRGVEAVLDGVKINPKQAAEGVWQIEIDPKRGVERSLEVTAYDLAGNEAKARVENFRFGGFFSALPLVPGAVSALGKAGSGIDGAIAAPHRSLWAMGGLCVGLAAGVAGLVWQFRRRVPRRSARRTQSRSL